MNRCFAWFLAAVSAVVALLSVAPFTAAIFLVVVLLPLAALAIWHGAALPGAIAVMLCAAAFFAGPITLSALIDLPVFATLVVLGFVAAAASLILSQLRRQAV